MSISSPSRAYRSASACRPASSSILARRLRCSRSSASVGTKSLSTAICFSLSPFWAYTRASSSSHLLLYGSTLRPSSFVVAAEQQQLGLHVRRDGMILLLGQYCIDQLACLGLVAFEGLLRQPGGNV